MTLRVVRELRYRRLLRRLAGPRVVQAFAAAHPEAFFVEIGANDGDKHDHLRPAILAGGWRGIMVEPVPYVFERLARNYSGRPGLALENAAIAERDGTRAFHYLAESDDPGLPGWYDAVGSFSRDAVLAHARHIPDVERRIVTAEVPCLTFESLCRKHDVERVDLLALDTEGHDWRILAAIDLDRWRPRLVIYEHYHLDPDDRSEARGHMEGAGYETMEEGFDTFCLDPRPDDALTRAWRRLSPAVAGVAASDE
jgi:FkbM family methyltransferase